MHIMKTLPATNLASIWFPIRFCYQLSVIYFLSIEWIIHLFGQHRKYRQIDISSTHVWLESQINSDRYSQKWVIDVPKYPWGFNLNVANKYLLIEVEIGGEWASGPWACLFFQD